MVGSGAMVFSPRPCCSSGPCYVTSEESGTGNGPRRWEARVRHRQRPTQVGGACTAQATAHAGGRRVYGTGNAGGRRVYGTGNAGGRRVYGTGNAGGTRMYGHPSGAHSGCRSSVKSRVRRESQRHSYTAHWAMSHADRGTTWKEREASHAHSLPAGGRDALSAEILRRLTDGSEWCQGRGATRCTVHGARARWKLAWNGTSPSVRVGEHSVLPAEPPSTTDPIDPQSPMWLAHTPVSGVWARDVHVELRPVVRGTCAA